jgi:MarC family membrane protein
VDIASAAILLILVLDPFGNIPLVLSTLGRVDEERRRRVVLRECAIAYGVLLLFLFAGRPLLELMRLSETAIGLAGGFILFIIALRMVFNHPEGPLGSTGSTGTGDANDPHPSDDGEPFIVPLAVPAIAGPSAMATVIVFTSREPQRWPEWLAAITIAMAVSIIVLLMAERISRIIGKRGVIALERLMGLILTAIAVEMLLSGITAYVRSLSTPY